MRFFDASPYAIDKALACIRIIVGALLIYHGQEMFHQKIVDGYLTWDVFKGSNGKLLVYFGKTIELLAGLSLFFGLFTRVGAVFCIGALSFITFVIGNGRVWYEDQHPFLFVLFGVLFLFSGPGAWSLDGRPEESKSKSK